MDSSLVVVGSMQYWCGDYWGSVSGIEQKAMVGSAGEGIGSHGFSCGSNSGSSTSVDSVVDVCSGYI